MYRMLKNEQDNIKLYSFCDMHLNYLLECGEVPSCQTINILINLLQLSRLRKFRIKKERKYMFNG